MSSTILNELGNWARLYQFSPDVGSCGPVEGLHPHWVGMPRQQGRNEPFSILGRRTATQQNKLKVARNFAKQGSHEVEKGKPRYLHRASYCGQENIHSPYIHYNTSIQKLDQSPSQQVAFRLFPLVSLLPLK